ncbi:hypothetical protein VP01_926g3 [Puccinia sorghi]|uniref:Uncharacterized protein n=1 Tax=Puccinia sorghi TaxID=27349 RepID=A0A0L6U760_9BASI|nr:hypothetical protein VP01_926g3 [Puccinia sorghi]
MGFNHSPRVPDKRVPIQSSPWTHLRQVRNSRAFTAMGVNVRTFQTLLILFEIAWISSTIPRSDVNPNGIQQPATDFLNHSNGASKFCRFLGLQLSVNTTAH